MSDIITMTRGLEDYKECPQCGVHPVGHNASGTLITTHVPGDRTCLLLQIDHLQAIVDKQHECPECGGSAMLKCTNSKCGAMIYQTELSTREAAEAAKESQK